MDTKQQLKHKTEAPRPATRELKRHAGAQQGLGSHHLAEQILEEAPPLTLHGTGRRPAHRPLLSRRQHPLSGVDIEGAVCALHSPRLGIGRG